MLRLKLTFWGQNHICKSIIGIYFTGELLDVGYFEKFLAQVDLSSLRS